MRTGWQLIRCLLGKHKPIGFSDKRRTVVLCESCLTKIQDGLAIPREPESPDPIPTRESLEEIRNDPRFNLIMSCLWLDIVEMANRFDDLKHDYAEGARAAAAYVSDHWKHGDHLKHTLEQDVKRRLRKLLDSQTGG